MVDCFCSETGCLCVFAVYFSLLNSSVWRLAAGRTSGYKTCTKSRIHLTKKWPEPSRIVNDWRKWWILLPVWHHPHKWEGTIPACRHTIRPGAHWCADDVGRVAQFLWLHLWRGVTQIEMQSRAGQHYTRHTLNAALVILIMTSDIVCPWILMYGICLSGCHCVMGFYVLYMFLPYTPLLW